MSQWTEGLTVITARDTVVAFSCFWRRIQNCRLTCLLTGPKKTITRPDPTHSTDWPDLCQTLRWHRALIHRLSVQHRGNLHRVWFPTPHININGNRVHVDNVKARRLNEATPADYNSSNIRYCITKLNLSRGNTKLRAAIDFCSQGQTWPLFFHLYNQLRYINT